MSKKRENNPSLEKKMQVNKLGLAQTYKEFHILEYEHNEFSDTDEVSA